MSKYKVLSDQELMAVLGGTDSPTNDTYVGKIVNVYYKGTDGNNSALKALITQYKDIDKVRYHYFDFEDTFFSGWYIYNEIIDTVFDSEIDLKGKRKVI